MPPPASHPPRAYVRLPWAQACWWPPAAGALSHGSDAPDPNAAAAAVQTAAAPPSVGHRTGPEIPAEDRVALTQEAVIDLSVALDVLATMTRRLPRDPTILHALTAAAAQVGAFGGVDDDGLRVLLGCAAGDIGDDRAEVSHALSRRAALAAGASEHDGSDTTIGRSMPHDVFRAISRIEAATQEVIRQARLLLDVKQAGRQLLR